MNPHTSLVTAAIKLAIFEDMVVVVSIVYGLAWQYLLCEDIMPPAYSTKVVSERKKKRCTCTLLAMQMMRSEKC